MSLTRWVAVGIGALLSATSLAAQTRPASPPAVVHVRVAAADSTAIEAVTLTVLSGSGKSVALGRTDASGRATLSFVVNDTAYQLIARRIGYAEGTRALHVARGDTIDVAFTLTRVAQSLDTVRATGRMLSNNYTLGAAEIAASTRNIQDAYDALRDLRPLMLGDNLRLCGRIQNLWVNGELQPLYPAEIFGAPPSSGTGGGRTTRSDGSGRPPLHGGGGVLPAHVPAGSPLAIIDPAHIEEMRYTNCQKNPLAGGRSVNALFITLKPGLGYDVKRGSYVADSAVARAAHVIP